MTHNANLPALLVCLAALCACTPPKAPGPSTAASEAVLTDDRFVTMEDTALELDVLVNDIGADAISELGVPEHGSVEVTSEHRVRYVPAADFNGTDRFTYHAADLRAEVVVEVSPVNDAPVVSQDIAHTMQGESVEIDVLANDSDPDGDELRLLGVTQGRFGRASVEGGLVVYQPGASFIGADHFLARIRDEGGVEADGDVFVAVGGEPGGPLAFGDSVVLVEGQQLELDVLSNDLSPQGDALSVEISTAPLHVEATVVEGESLSLSAGTGFNGHDAFSVRVTDMQGRVSVSQVDVTVFAQTEPDAPQVLMPRTGMVSRELALIVNTDDPISEEIAAYYAEQRGIPRKNIIEVALGTADRIDPGAFAPVLTRVEQNLPERIQGYALAWTAPYLVGCMSMTSAFAVGGYDDRWCNTSGNACSLTEPVETFDTDSTEPFEDHGVRPAMMLAGSSLEEVVALIDRGVAADHTFPTGEGFLLRTTDAARSVRYPDFEAAARLWAASGALSLSYSDRTVEGGGNTIEGVDGVLIYLTGLTQVGGLDTLGFRPGAVADHLTSFGGRLTATSGQMSILRWLEAGATASYGTAVEPCNYTMKFPQATVLLDHYYRGATVLEAYWKSVNWPGEGVFVGEPLASPWGRATITFEGQTLTISTTALAPGRPYALQGADSVEGPFEDVQTIEIEGWGVTVLRVEGADRAAYRLTAL